MARPRQTGTPAALQRAAWDAYDRARAARQAVREHADLSDRLAALAQGLHLHHVACSHCAAQHVVPGRYVDTQHGGCGGTLRTVGGTCDPGVEDQP